MVDNNQTDEVLQELQDDMLNPELIQDNKLHFRSGKGLYRINAPTQKDISEASSLKNSEYFRLLQLKNTDGTYAHMVEKNLIKLLKDSQNIDIDALSKEIDNGEEELMQKYLELARRHDSDVDGIVKDKDDIQEIKDKRLKKVLNRAEYLAPSIQNQANDIYYKFLTAVCTEEYLEINKKGHWVKVWKSYETYINDRSNLVYVSLGRLTELLLNV